MLLSNEDFFTLLILGGYRIQDRLHLDVVKTNTPIATLQLMARMFPHYINSWSLADGIASVGVQPEDDAAFNVDEGFSLSLRAPYFSVDSWDLVMGTPAGEFSLREHGKEKFLSALGDISRELTGLSYLESFLVRWLLA